MSISAAKRAAQKKRRETKIELVAFEVKKGMSEQYTQWAAAMGVGKMEMIRRAIEEYIANHGGEHVAPVKSAPIGTVLTAEQKKILEAVDSLPESSRKALLKFLQTLVDAKSD